jgi:DNA polymerase-3 subunit delta
MTALKTADIDAFVARPDPARPIVLVFGPDAGLVHERAERIVRASVDDTADPFSLARLDGDDLSGDPTRLVDEANTIPLFGGKRAVWVKAGTRNISAAVEALLAAPSPDCRVIIEAGDLKRGAPLRNLCERAKIAVAIPCYVDGEREIARLIDDEMRSTGLSIAADARAALIPLLGGDRQASRNEIRKLALYAHGNKQVTLEDVVAVVSEASALALDGIVDAMFAGRTGEAESQFAKARAAGTAPGTIVSAALRQLSQLHKFRLAVEGGKSITQVVEAAQPQIHFRRKPLVEAALKAWTAARLLRAMAQLAEAALEVRRQPTLADTLAQRAVLSIAVSARRRDS